MLVDKARSAVEKYDMFGPGDRVVVGVSGGPDSVALLRWLSGFARERGFQLHIAHLDHMLRGEESAADARWVQNLAEDLGLPHTIEAIDVQAVRDEMRLSLEDAARQARYSFFAHVVKEVEARGVAVAHTADDQVETIVLHWLRGAGLAGLRGMQPVTTYRVVPGFESSAADVRVVRPLLEVWRSEVESYLEENGLSARLDRSNLELDFLRNKVRQQLIPYLQSYNPRIKESVLRSAEFLGADYDFIRSNVAEVWDSVARVGERKVTFDLTRWLELPESLQRHMLREAMCRLVGDVIGLSSVHIDSALAIIRSGRTGASVTWPRGLEVKKSYDSFLIGFCGPRREPSLSIEGQRLEVPGGTKIYGTPWEVKAVLRSRPCGDAQPHHADLDFERVGKHLVVRRRKPGDRFRPLGMKGEKSLQDFFVDAKVPEEERDEVPIVSSSDHVVWIVGSRIDDRVKVTPSTKDVLCLRFLKSNGG